MFYTKAATATKVTSSHDYEINSSKIQDKFRSILKAVILCNIYITEENGTTIKMLNKSETIILC